MLNEYHVKFLHHLVSYEVTFMVIGGQARRLLNPVHHTMDLDVWVRLAEEDVAPLERAVIAWGQEHPQHTNLNLVSPLGIRPGLQIAFPENDGVGFLTRAGEVATIDTNERVDLLTSLEGMNFDDCLRRAQTIDVDGVAVHAMCGADLDAATVIREKRRSDEDREPRKRG